MSNSTVAIHVARKQLGLDDDTYRAKLQNITGKTSTKDMTEAERQRVLTVFRNDGFHPAATTSKGLSGKFAKKLQALWIAGWNLGLVRDRRDAALLVFVKNQTGIDHVRFLHVAADGRSAIEALKGWLKREAGVTFGNTNGQDWLARDGAKIAWAQWRILHPTAGLIRREGFDQEAFRLSGRADIFVLDHMSDADWRKVMNVLGERVRASKKGGA
jgi:phage gp16-like protein